MGKLKLREVMELAQCPTVVGARMERMQSNSRLMLFYF